MKWISEDGDVIHQHPDRIGTTMHERCVRRQAIRDTITDLPEVDGDGEELDLFHHSCIICGRSVRATKVIPPTEQNHFL